MLTRVGEKGQALTGLEHDANIDHFEQNPNGIYAPKAAATTGIFIDSADPTRAYEDLLGDIYFEPGSPNEPTFVTWNGNIKKRQFDVNDECFITLHLNHNYALGTDIYFHIHWSHNVFGLTAGLQLSLLRVLMLRRIINRHLVCLSAPH